MERREDTLGCIPYSIQLTKFPPVMKRIYKSHACITFLIMFSSIVFAQDIGQMVNIGQEKSEIKKELGAQTEIKETAK